MLCYGEILLSHNSGTSTAPITVHSYSCGEAVYAGTHEGDRLIDHCNNNRIGGCQLGPDVIAEAIDFKADTKKTIVKNNKIIGNGMAFLKIGRGTVRIQNSQLNYSGVLANTYSSGEITNQLDINLPPAHQYTGHQNNSKSPTTESSECLPLERKKKIEIALNQHDCVDTPTELFGRLLQVWDSNANTGCHFRGKLVSSTDNKWDIFCKLGKKTTHDGSPDSYRTI